jgi:hypothetical protein
MLVSSPSDALGEAAEAGSGLGVKPVIEAIGALESVRDPKCYATASRLEDFMYGTPLTSEARHRKVGLQKAMIQRLWVDASELARAGSKASVDATAIQSATARYLGISQDESGGAKLILPDRPPISIKFDDLRQYSSIAYALRAILGVQQDLIFAPDERFLTLGEPAVDEIKRVVDLVTLAVLKEADQAARLRDSYEITAADLERSWRGLTSHVPELEAPTSEPPPAGPRKPAELSLLRQVIAQKLASYEAYNKISTPVFLRNIQVYFARYRWPSDPETSKDLKAAFTEAMVFFALDLYTGCQERAALRDQGAIRGEDVTGFASSFIPHRINEYEDALFFPALPPAERVEIESYDMDAFRDSGLHWRYLEAALDEPSLKATLEADPFAAELLVENIAQFGVLLLRMAGEAAGRARAATLSRQHIASAVQEIRARIQRNNAPPEVTEAQAAPDLGVDRLASSDLHPPRTRPSRSATSSRYFADVTEASGISLRHSSADWLHRLIRSYTIRDENVAVLAVPPAFQGSGVAAEDVDGDGLTDVLLLSGHGNRLYRNEGGGKFEDVTQAAGLRWRREEDGRPGEARQPIIADFDNDGHQDIFISYVDDDHRLYRNLGGWKFQDVTASSGLGGKGRVGGPVTAADFDGDGLLDIYVGNFGLYTEGIKPTLARRNINGLPNQLFRNLGGLRFRDVTAGSGVDNRGWTQALAHTDFDRDGRQDLIVGNDFGVNSYYRNLGDWKFVDFAPLMGTDKPSYTMNVGLADLNDDLFPDVYISNIVTMDKDQKYVHPGEDTPAALDARKMAKMRVVEANDLFLSRAKEGKLSSYRLSSAIGRGRSSTGWAWGASFLDVDNDGDDDLYVTNGMNECAVHSAENPYYVDPEGKSRDVLLPEDSKESNVFFLNAGGKLTNVSALSGVDLLGNSRAVAYLDLDGDGDQDMVLNNYHADAVVYRNNAESLGNNWLRVRLVGDPEKGSSRDAIGARIIARTEDGYRIWREVRGSEGYLTMHPKEQHFGLGKAPSASITVEWPGGATSEFDGVEASHRYVIEQATGEIRRLAAPHEPQEPQQLSVGDAEGPGGSLQPRHGLRGLDVRIQGVAAVRRQDHGATLGLRQRVLPREAGDPLEARAHGVLVEPVCEAGFGAEDGEVRGAVAPLLAKVAGPGDRDVEARDLQFLGRREAGGAQGMERSRHLVRADGHASRTTLDLDRGRFSRLGDRLGYCGRHDHRHHRRIWLDRGRRLHALQRSQQLRVLGPGAGLGRGRRSRCGRVGGRRLVLWRYRPCGRFWRRPSDDHGGSRLPSLRGAGAHLDAQADQRADAERPDRAERYQGTRGRTLVLGAGHDRSRPSRWLPSRLSTPLSIPRVARPLTPPRRGSSRWPRWPAFVRWPGRGARARSGRAGSSGASPSSCRTRGSGRPRGPRSDPDSWGSSRPLRMNRQRRRAHAGHDGADSSALCSSRPSAWRRPPGGGPAGAGRWSRRSPRRSRGRLPGRGHAPPRGAGSGGLRVPPRTPRPARG